MYEQRNLVSTPKSLEACRLEGVEPHELLYRQRDSFLEEAEDEEHAQLLYEYHEKQRQDILRLVTQRRQMLDGGLDRSSRQSRSSGNLFHSELFDKEVERAREKHVKMITQIMGYEMSASSKLNELQKTQSERETLEQHRQRAIQVRMKRVAEEKNLARMLERLLSYRIFGDAQGRMNCSLKDTGGGLLLVPQFTLVADTRKGTRPSFSSAAPPDEARRLFEALVVAARDAHAPVATGVFGAEMFVSLTNHGPVTFRLEA